MNSNDKSKKLGFRDKIKKMLELETDDVKPQTQIMFTLHGGKFHSELLVAEAILATSLNDLNGVPLPVVCKWFNRSKTNEITEIEGVSGAFYQPNADDINSYIIVEAKPVLEDEQYSGELLKKEIGPLVLDPQIEEEVQELLEAGRFKIASRIEIITNSSDDFSNIGFPIPCSINIDSKKVTLTVESESELNAECQLGSQFPLIKIIKKTNNTFELTLSENRTYRLTAQSNTHRDVIAVALRLFCGKRVMEQESHIIMNQSEVIPADIDKEQVEKQDQPLQISVNSTGLGAPNGNQSIDFLLKLNDLTKKVADLEAQRDQQKQELIKRSEEVKQLNGALIEKNQIISELKAQSLSQTLQIDSYKSKHAQYMSEKLFLTQETASMQGELETRQSELNELKKEYSLLLDELTEKRKNEKERSDFQISISNLQEQISTIEASNKSTEKNLAAKVEEYNDILAQNNTLLGQLNHLRKKNQCLQQELQSSSSMQSLESPHPKEKNKIINHTTGLFFQKDLDDSFDQNDKDTVSKTPTSESGGKSSSVPQSFAFLPPQFIHSNSDSKKAVNNINFDVLNNNETKFKAELKLKQDEISTLLAKITALEKIQSTFISTTPPKKGKESISSNSEMLLQKLVIFTQISYLTTQNQIIVDSIFKNFILLKKTKNNFLKYYFRIFALFNKVNSLTEMITEKDLAIDNLKNINKDLANRLTIGNISGI